MGRYRCVLFDMDGTLLDSLDDLRDSMNHVLKAHALWQALYKGLV